MALVQDEHAIVELSTLIEEPENQVQEKIFNHINRRRKIGHELRMNAQIGDYDMDFIILDLGLYMNIITRCMSVCDIYITMV